MSKLPTTQKTSSPFPLTPIQEAYWLGRSNYFDYGDVTSIYYLEIEGGLLNRKRLAESLNTLIDRNEALRTIFQSDGRQKVMNKVPAFEIEHIDFSHLKEDDSRLSTIKLIRSEMTNKSYGLDEWPLFDIRYATLGNGKARLFCCLNLIVLDGFSIGLFFDSWRKLYENDGLESHGASLTFRDYMACREVYKEGVQYRIKKVSSIKKH